MTDDATQRRGLRSEAQQRAVFFISADEPGNIADASQGKAR